MSIIHGIENDSNNDISELNLLKYANYAEYVAKEASYNAIKATNFEISTKKTESYVIFRLTDALKFINILIAEKDARIMDDLSKAAIKAISSLHFDDPSDFTCILRFHKMNYIIEEVRKANWSGHFFDPIGEKSDGIPLYVESGYSYDQLLSDTANAVTNAKLANHAAKRANLFAEETKNTALKARRAYDLSCQIIYSRGLIVIFFSLLMFQRSIVYALILTFIFLILLRNLYREAKEAKDEIKDIINKSCKIRLYHNREL